MDGRDGSEIKLIDGKGCPTDPTIMQEVEQVNICLFVFPFSSNIIYNLMYLCSFIFPTFFYCHCRLSNLY